MTWKLLVRVEGIPTPCDITPIMENQMEKNMENHMATAIYRVM